MSIELRLDCMEQGPSKVELRLVVENREPHRILLPHPEITGLQFSKVAGANAQWYTRQMVSSDWAGFVLGPGESKAVTFSVRPTSLLRSGSDYPRWCVDIRPGRYAVRYSMVIDRNYFDGDSHYRFPQVEREARMLGVVAWS